MEQQLEEADREVVRLQVRRRPAIIQDRPLTVRLLVAPQATVDELMSAPFDAGSLLQTAVKASAAAKQKADSARARRDDTKLRLAKTSEVGARCLVGRTFSVLSRQHRPGT